MRRTQVIRTLSTILSDKSTVFSFWPGSIFAIGGLFCSH